MVDSAGSTMTSESLQSHVRIPTWVALKYGKLEYGGKELTYLSHLRATLAELICALADQQSEIAMRRDEMRRRELDARRVKPVPDSPRLVHYPGVAGSPRGSQTSPPPSSPRLVARRGEVSLTRL